MATCTGRWARYGCCSANQGKQQWAEAVKLYWQLYRDAADPGSKCDALRRIAEIQCNCMDLWREGLATYLRILEEFPESPHCTNRTCGSLNGTNLIDRDLMDFTLRRLLREAKSAEDAVRVREEFVELAPSFETVKFHSLWQLAEALRERNEPQRAAAIDAKLGLCDKWLVIGLFDNNDGVMDKTAYGPEKDFLSGKIDLAKAHDCCTAQLRLGTSGGVKAWLNRDEILAVKGGADFSIMDQYVRPVQLKKGSNELFIKLAVATGFCPNIVRITDAEGTALGGITYSVPAVPPSNEERSDFLRRAGEG